MRSRRASTPLSMAMLTTLSLLAGAILQVTLLARPAAADMPSFASCEYHGKLTPEYFPGATVWWKCNIVNGKRWWSIFEIFDTPYHSKRQEFSDNSPCWIGQVTAGVAKGYTNGFGLSAFAIKDCNNHGLVRRIAVELVIKNRSNGQKCYDSNWREAATERSVYTIEAAMDLPDICGGTGYYESLARGRFWSETLNTWITTSYVLSQQIYLVNCCAPERSP